MLAELIFTYFFISNMSSHLNVDQRPAIDSEVRLELDHNFTPKINLKMEPYVMMANGQSKIAGAEFELNYEIRKNMKLGFYHHSSHSLDVVGRGLEVDGIRFRMRLN